MLLSVARVFKWASPKELSLLYVDDYDYQGLGFWYNDALEQERELKNN